MLIVAVNYAILCLMYYIESTQCECGQRAFNKKGVCWDCRTKYSKEKNPILHIRENITRNLKPFTYRLLLKANMMYKNFDNKFQGRERTRELVRIRDKYTCQSCNKKWHR